MSLFQSATREVAINLTSRPGARLVTLLMVALAFIVFDTFLIISWNLQGIMDREENLVGMEVFLQRDVSQAQGMMIGDNISSMPDVKSVYYVSPQEAEALFRAELPGRADLLDVMGNDFRLPASLQIVFDAETMSQGRISELSRQIGSIAGVDDAVYGEDYLPGLLKTVTTIRRLVILLGIVLVSSISMVVFYTVRLSVVRRSLTVDIMRIVGAPWWFIRIPFVIEGVFMGVIGSAGGLAISAILSKVLAGAVTHRFMPLSWMTFVILLGAVTGTVGALAGSYEKER
ncbi:MAG: permease-like cell division protein FtsX [Candidatus Fermentibacteria bacterium]|nr:permease-like cell division protein FtsX [Candidatus Fermentibacteria bacterium]